MIEEYVQQLSGYFLQLKFDPELLFGTQFQYRNRIAMEFNQLYHWHPLMPDSFRVGSQVYSYEQFLFNTSMLVDYGVEALVDAFSRQSAGRVSLEEPRGGWVGPGTLQTWIQIPVFFSEKRGQCPPCRAAVSVPAFILLPFCSPGSTRCCSSCWGYGGDQDQCGSWVLVLLVLNLGKEQQSRDS